MLAFGITTHGGIDKNNGRHIVEFSDEQASLELLFKENLKYFLKYLTVLLTLKQKP